MPVALKIILAFLAVMFLAVGAFALTRFVILPQYQILQAKKEIARLEQSNQKVEKKDTKASKDKKKKTPVKKVGEVGEIFRISEITVNTYASRGRRFVVVDYAVESADKAVIDEIKRREPQIRDMLINYLRKYSADEMLELGFQEKSRHELMKLINSRLNTGQIDSLYYMALVIQ